MKTIYNSVLWTLLLCVSFVMVQCSKSEDTPAPKNSAKTLENLKIDGIASTSVTSDANTSSYTVTVPFAPLGTDLTALKLAFTLPNGAMADPASGSVQNFNNTVRYIVTAEDGSRQTYNVQVVQSTRSSVATGLQDKSVRFLYFIPTDKQYNADYEKAFEKAAINVQNWYREKTGGYTFKLNSPIVEIYKGKQTSKYYSENKKVDDPKFNFIYNTWDESANYGMQYPETRYRWIIFEEVDGYGAAIANNFAVLPGEYLLGLVGKNDHPALYWTGGMAHELGHTFSLEHPTTPDNALMLYGWAGYPNCVLLPKEIDILKKSLLLFKTP